MNLSLILLKYTSEHEKYHSFFLKILVQISESCDNFQASVRYIHSTGLMHNTVMHNLKEYVHKNIGLKEYLSRLVDKGKKLFMVTNSPFPFMLVLTF